MKRWLPYPLLAACLFLMWLLLTQSFSPGQIVLGAAVTFLATGAMAKLRRSPAPIRAWRKVARLAAIVLVDVIRSNLAVTRICLSPRPARHAQFIRLTLELRDQQALAVLALIITATPGTAWVQFNRTDGTLIIHVFDLVDEEAWVRLLKTRYERLLMEIFEQ